MKTSSAKAKGRRHQQKIRDDLRSLGLAHGLEPADCESVGMGQSGEDIILTPAARRIFDLNIEAKNVESLNVSTTFFKHHKTHEKKSGLKLLVHAKNRTPALVTLLWDDFLELLKNNLPLKKREPLT